MVCLFFSSFFSPYFIRCFSCLSFLFPTKMAWQDAETRDLEIRSQQEEFMKRLNDEKERLVVLLSFVVLCCVVRGFVMLLSNMNITTTFSFFSRTHTHTRSLSFFLSLSLFLSPSLFLSLSLPLSLTIAASSASFLALLTTHLRCPRLNLPRRLARLP